VYAAIFLPMTYELSAVVIHSGRVGPASVAKCWPIVALWQSVTHAYASGPASVVVCSH